MGRTEAFVAIVVSIGIAVLLLVWARKPSKPPAKAALPAADNKKKETGDGKASPAKAEGKGDPAPAGKADAKAKADPKAKAASADAKVKAADGEPAARAKTVPDPAVKRKASGVPSVVEKLHPDDEDDDITIVTLTPRLDLMAAASGELPDASGDDADGDEERGPPESERAAAVPIIYDAEAAEDEPTRAHAVILVAAVGQTDTGQKRKINEDRYLALDDHSLYVVADGMGGHAGGEVASQLAVDVIAKAFKDQEFEGAPYEGVPRRGSELALAIQMANRAIHERAKREPKLLGMGTTIVSARFTPGKERVYIGHVGDSRCYRFRAGQLTQITTDHTMGAIGMTGPIADHLSRAVGIAPAVKVDLVIAKPRHDDVFLLCSDGLSKMVKDDAIRDILAANEDPNEAVKALVQRANEKGGRDNITVIVVVVKDPTGFVRYAQQQQQKKRAEAEAEAEAAGAAPDAGDKGGAAPEAKASDKGAPSEDARQSARITVPDARQSGSVALADARQSAKVVVPDARQSGRITVPDARQSAKVAVPDATADPAASGERTSVPPRPSSHGRPSAPDARPSSPDAKGAPVKEPAPAPDEPPPDSRPSDGSSKKRKKNK
jgi:serine/threonine protein phosphatase PrpC